MAQPFESPETQKIMREFREHLSKFDRKRIIKDNNNQFHNVVTVTAVVCQLWQEGKYDSAQDLFSALIRSFGHHSFMTGVLLATTDPEMNLTDNQIVRLMTYVEVTREKHKMYDERTRNLLEVLADLVAKK